MLKSKVTVENKTYSIYNVGSIMMRYGIGGAKWGMVIYEGAAPLEGLLEVKGKLFVFPEAGLPLWIDTTTERVWALILPESDP